MSPGRVPAARLKDVAEAAGVHVSTASRALNERTASLVQEETLLRVREAAQRLGYRVNGMARALKTRRSSTVGMLVPDITNPFFPPAVRGAEDVLAQFGFSVLLANGDNDECRVRRQVSAMLEARVDGLLLAMARRDDAVVAELAASGIPVVQMNRMVDRGGISAVVPDDYHGIVQAVEHLHGLGHRSIGCVSGPLFSSNSTRRVTSFQETMTRLGCPVAPVLEAEAFNVPAGTDAGARLLAVNPELTAVVATNDLLAIGVLQAAGAAGRPCPEKLSVVGFNDMFLAAHVAPPLTTVRVAQYEVGRRAAQLLLSLVEDPQRRPETVVISGELVVRASTGPPPEKRGATRG
jgi:LacI family transcriptional regulator